MGTIEKQNGCLSIEETPDGPVIQVQGNTVTVVKLYGLLTQSILQNTTISRKLLDKSVDLSADLWAAMADGMTTIDLSRPAGGSDGSKEAEQHG